MKTAVVIPNWNGEELLKKNLPAVLEAGFDEVVVVDDCSTDRSVEQIQNSKLKIKSYNSKFKIIKNKKNLGFAKSVNLGVSATSADVVFLFNTDVAPIGDVISRVMEHFKDPKVFGVSLNEGKFGWAKPKIENGFLGHEPGGRTAKAHNTFWVSGGSGAFRKSMWVKLGGFDSLYSPFYWEDVDLCYQALKRGWKLVWEPQARVEHEHEASINTRYFTARYLNYIKERNQLLFHWKNLPLKWLLTKHLLGIFRRLSNPGYFFVVFLALLHLLIILVRRLKDANHIIRDEDVLARFEVSL